MWTVASSADRAAAESGVAGLGSEARATLCAEWLKPLLQRSDSDESCPAKTCRSVEAQPQADTAGSAGLLPCQPGRHMYGAAAELQLCPSRSCWRRARAQEGDVLAVDDVLDEPA